MQGPLDGCVSIVQIYGGIGLLIVSDRPVNSCVISEQIVERV